jgi:hypothetical protein
MDRISCAVRLAALMPLFVSCSASDDVRLGANLATAAVIAPEPSSQLDVLFVIDASGSMQDEQQRLSLLARQALFEAIGAGGVGVPDLHLGIVTSDVHVPGITGCEAGEGALLPLGERGCTSGGNFMIDVDAGDGTRTRNFDDFDTAFQCAATVGVSGCGFEQHLEALRLSLVHPDNATFFRPEANLLIVILADEDDCSASAADFYDPAAQQYGPIGSYRCVRNAVTCAESLDEPGVKTDCVLATEGPMTAVDTYIDAVLAAKSDPAKIIVTTVVGDPEHFTVNDVSSDIAPDALQAESCVAEWDPEAVPAAPAFRLAAFAHGFPGREINRSICAPLEGALADTAGLTADSLTMRGCLRGEFRDVDPGTAGVQPSCEAVDVVAGQEQAIGACSAGATPCLRLETDAACTSSPGQLRAVIDRGGEAAPAGSHALVRCRVGE